MGSDGGFQTVFKEKYPFFIKKPIFALPKWLFAGGIRPPNKLTHGDGIINE